MKELFQSIFDSSTDRIKNPFIGSFATAFLLYNWRPIFLLLFSDAIIEDKIVVINNEYCNAWAIIIPIVIAILYIVVLPYINLGFDGILTYSNNKKKEREKVSVLNKLIQRKHEARLEREIAEELAGTSEINNLKDQIERFGVEKNILIEKEKESFEKYTKSLETIKSQEDQINKILSDLNNQDISAKNGEDIINQLRDNLDDAKIEIKDLSQYVINGFSQDEIENFKNYYDFLNGDFSKIKEINLNGPTTKKLIDRGFLLYNIETGRFSLSALSTVAYKAAARTMPFLFK